MSNAKITRLQVANFKRIVEVDVAIDGSVIIGGSNTEGKSSLLDSIHAALLGGANIPSDPVHHGEPGASIRIELDNGIVVERTITPDRKHKLKLSGGTGGVTPQRWLDGHVSATTLDPLAILSLPPKDKVAMLRQLSGCDTSELDDAYTRAFETRAGANKDAANAKVALEQLHVTEGLPEDPVDMNDLVLSLRHANQHNDVLRRKVDTLNRLRAERTEKLEEIERAKKRVEFLMGELEETTAKGMTLRGEVIDQTEMDTIAIEASIRDVTKTNEAINENKRHAVAGREAKRLHGRAVAADQLVKDIDAKRKELLDSASWPLPGIGVENGAVTFNGVPLEQASQAEQLRVAVALAAAGKPQVGVVLVREGCRLDSKSLQLLLNEVAAAGLQAFVERVGDGDTGAIVIEDGRVRG
jgi:hypothetical protein